MADFIWVGDISADWNDIGNWRDSAGAPVVALPGVADDCHFGEYIGGGAPWGQSAFIAPAGVSVNNVYFYGAGGGFAPLLGPLDGVRTFTLDLQGTLTCEEIYCLTGDYLNPLTNGGGPPNSLTFTGPAGITASSRLHIDGGTFQNLGTLIGADLSVKASQDPPVMAASSVVASGSIGISCDGWSIAELTFSGPSLLGYSAVLAPHDFDTVNIGTLNINANVTSVGNAATPGFQHMFTVQTCNIDPSVTVNTCRVTPQTLNQVHGIVFTQNANDRYGKLVVADGAVVMSSQGFTGYGDLELKTNGSLTLNTSVACQIGRFIGPGQTASTLHIGDITSNGGAAGQFMFDILDYPHHSTIDITIDNSTGSHTPSSIDVVFRTGSGPVELMRLNSFSVMGATTVNVAAESSASSVTIGQGTLSGEAVTAESFTFRSGAVGFTNSLNIRPGASTTTIYDAQTALTTTSGTVTLYPYTLGTGPYTYQINGNRTSHTVGAFPFVVTVDGDCKDYNINCNLTAFSSFSSNIVSTTGAKTLTFTYTDRCFIGTMAISGGAVVPDAVHNSFIHQTGTASTDRISLFTTTAGVIVPDHAATTLRTQAAGQLWFRNSTDSDFIHATLQQGNRTTATHNVIQLGSTTARALTTAQSFTFDVGSELLLEASLPANCSIETRNPHSFEPTTSSEYQVYFLDDAVITFEGADAQEDFYIVPNITTGNWTGIRYPIAANAVRVPAYVPDGPSKLENCNTGSIICGALEYPAGYQHIVPSGFLSTRHKGYSGDTRKSLDIRGTVTSTATFSLNLDSTTTTGQIRFDNDVEASPGFFLSCQAARTIAVEFTGSFEMGYARFAGTSSSFIINNSSATDSILTLSNYGFDSRGSMKVTWDHTLDVHINDCPFRVENTQGWENVVNVRVLSGACAYTFPFTITPTYKKAPQIQIDTGASLHPTASGQVAHHMFGPGTFNWRGLVTSGTVDFFFIANGGNLDSQLVQYQQDASCAFKITAYSTPSNNPILNDGSYTIPIYIGYQTGATITGDFTVTSTIATNFYRGLHLNYNQVTPTTLTHKCGAFTTNAICRVEDTLNVYSYGQLTGGSQTNIVDCSGVIEYTAAYDAVTAINTLHVIAVTENCLFTGVGFMAHEELVIAATNNTFLVELPNIKGHDGSQGTLYIGQYTSGTEKPVSVYWQSAHLNRVVIGADSIIHRRGGTAIPQTRFMGTMTRSHLVTDKNETAKTVSHGEDLTYYGTSSLGRVTVESGQDLEFAQFGTNNGVILDSLDILGNTVTMNANTIRILGEATNNFTVKVNGGGAYLAPGYSATNLVTTQIYEIIGSSPHNAIELYSSSRAELGSANDYLSTVMFKSDILNSAGISAGTGETLKLRNCRIKAHNIDTDQPIIYAMGTSCTVAIKGCQATLSNSFAEIRNNVDGTFEDCRLECTANKPIVIFGDNTMTSVTHHGNMTFRRNYLVNTSAADTLVEFNGTWYWNRFSYNHLVFSGQTGTGISQAIKINADQSIGNFTHPLKHWTFSIPSNFGPVRADNRMLRAAHCNMATTNSEVGKYGATNQNQIFAAVNGANRQTIMLGGNQLTGEQEVELFSWYPQWSTSGGGFSFVQNGEDVFLTNLVNDNLYLDSASFAYNPSDTYTVSWVDLDADNPVTVKPIFEYTNGTTPGNASNLTNGGNLPTTSLGIRVVLRVQLPALTSGFTDLVVTNTTQSAVVFSEYWPYKPAMSDTLVPASGSTKLIGNAAYDATTDFPSQPIPPHIKELRPNKPRYEILVDRGDLATNGQYHIMFGYQDSDNYYVARYHMLSASTVQCTLWKKVSGTTSQVGTNTNFTVPTYHPHTLLPVDFGLTWTPGTEIRWRVDGSDGATVAITEFSDGGVGFDSRNSVVVGVGAYETEGFTARNADLYFSSGHEYVPITNGVNLYNCTVNMNSTALFPTLTIDGDDITLEQTTFAESKLHTHILGFMELRGMELELSGDIVLGESGKLHMYGCILYRANEGRWKIDTRGTTYTDTPPIKIRSCQLRGIYTTILTDGVLTVIDDASLGSYLIRIYARKEMRIKRNRVLGLDFSRSITDGFQSNEQDVEIHVVNNMSIPGKLDTYWRNQEVFEFISPYCYEWKGKIVAYRTAILETANVATQVRFTVEEWRDD